MKKTVKFVLLMKWEKKTSHTAIRKGEGGPFLFFYSARSSSTVSAPSWGKACS